MPRILFVCTANLYRSPLAAALFSRELQTDGRSQGWTVESAGTWTIPGQRIPSDFVMVAGAVQVNLENHGTRQVTDEMLARSDLIVVMEQGHREALRVEFPGARPKIHLLSTLADALEYDIPDPVNSNMPLEDIAAELARLVHRAFPRICQLALATRPVEPLR